MMRTSTSMVRVPPDALEGALLQDTQELDLKIGGQIPDLVEKQASSVGELEPALLDRGRPGEGPLLVAKELALQERLRKGGAVDLDERAVGARGVVVDGASDEFLAGPALPAEQDGGPAVGDLLDCVIDLPHPLALPHDTVQTIPGAELLLETAGLFQQSLPLAHHAELEIDRLSDQRSHDAEDPDILLERDPLGKEPIHAQDADGFSARLDRHRDEGHRFRAHVAARLGPIEELRLRADVGDHHGHPVLHHLAQDAFPLLICSARDLLGGHPDGDPDGQLLAEGVVQEDGALPHTHERVQDAQDAGEVLFQFQRGAEDLADLVESGKLQDSTVELCAFAWASAGHGKRALRRDMYGSPPRRGKRAASMPAEVRKIGEPKRLCIQWVRPRIQGRVGGE